MRKRNTDLSLMPCTLYSSNPITLGEAKSDQDGMPEPDYEEEGLRVKPHIINMHGARYNHNAYRTLLVSLTS